MSGVLSWLIDHLHEWSAVLPLPWFTFLGAFIEEVIAPIPSPVVMTLAGSIAASQDQPLLMLGILAIIGAIGKTIGSYIIYWLADKGEDVVLKGRLGKLLGVSHKEVEALGQQLNQGYRDDIVLFLLRAIPIVPTAPVSVMCGLIKINLRTYLVSTFFGTIVRNLLYLYFGYTSLAALEQLNEGFDSLENFGYLFLAVLMAGLIGWFYLQRRKGTGLSLFSKKDKSSST